MAAHTRVLCCRNNKQWKEICQAVELSRWTPDETVAQGDSERGVLTQAKSESSHLCIARRLVMSRKYRRNRRPVGGADDGQSIILVRKTTRITPVSERSA